MTALPYPLLSAALTVMWMTLNSFSVGHLVLGSIVGVVAGLGFAALTPDRIRLRRPKLIVELFLVVARDIIRSNIAVAQLIVTGGRHGQRTSGFVRIPLDLTDQNALALLAIIVTATPGTMWVEYDPSSGELLLHVFDLLDEDDWVDIIKNRYESRLMEIFI